ncbi:MAG TPA: four helix bundle protein, partial [Bacteroidales bacterium]|nr:four helix bundle protein [Bacteroidales bacterium]
MNGTGKFDLEERLVRFAVRISDLVESLPVSMCGKYLSGQLIRSGLSPALNYGEARSAESVNDFIHKMKIALKELRETFISLKIVQLKNYQSVRP